MTMGRVIPFFCEPCCRLCCKGATVGQQLCLTLISTTPTCEDLNGLVIPLEYVGLIESFFITGHVWFGVYDGGSGTSVGPECWGCNHLFHGGAGGPGSPGNQNGTRVPLSAMVVCGLNPEDLTVETGWVIELGDYTSLEERTDFSLLTGKQMIGGGITPEEAVCDPFEIAVTLDQYGGSPMDGLGPYCLPVTEPYPSTGNRITSIGAVLTRCA